MIKSIELKFTSGNDVLVERAVITRDEFMQIKQQAETIERLEKQLEELMHKDTEKAVTIERLKQGMKGDYDLDQWLDWAVSKKHMMETIERLRAAIKYSSDYLDENALNIIGSGSKAHRELKDALNKLEVGEL